MKTINDYVNKRVLVMGLAKSGKAAARLLKELKAEVLINDRTPLAENEDAKEMLAEGFEVVTGGHPVELLERNFDLIVKNPGIPYQKVELLQRAQELNIPIITEVQLAFEISEASFIGITATNGKTTTTTLIYEMLAEGGKSPLIAGNIGEVATEVAKLAKAHQVLVTELSSFQLMGITTFRPYISLLLNITEAHLDYHVDLSEYQQAKLNLIKQQTTQDYCVYNCEDPVILKGIEQTQANCVPFSLSSKVDGAYLLDGAIYFKDEWIVNVEDVLLKGDHNLQDVLGAICVSILYGCELDAIRTVLKRFTGVKHRLQFVDEVNGISFYNNSKATNMIATEMALKAFDNSIILIAGGLDRGHDLSGIIPYFSKIKSIVTFGETRYRFKALADEYQIPCTVYETLDQSVLKAYEQAVGGDVILFSPACASWDQYKNFEIRGDHFISLVERLK